MRLNFHQTRAAFLLAVMFVAGLLGSTIAIHPDANAQSGSHVKASQASKVNTDN